MNGMADKMHATQSRTNTMLVPGIGAQDRSWHGMSPTVRSSMNTLMELMMALMMFMTHSVSTTSTPVSSVAVLLVRVLTLRASDTEG